MKKVILITLILLSLATAVGPDIQAQGAGWGLDKSAGAQSQYMPNVGKLSGDAKVSDSVAYVIKSATNVLTIVVASIAILFTIINGFLMATSAGSDNLSKAKKGLMWSVGGLMLVIFAYIIAKTTISLVFTE